LVDLLTPNHLHARHAIAALEAGRHVACEKPLAGTLADARAMRDAARKHKRLKTFVWFNYRRCPAVAFAHQLVRRGRLGRIYHVRAHYLQEWGGRDTPLSWRYQGKLAGSGAHGDLNAHIIDMTRFVTGEEITEVSGSIAETFIATRRGAGASRKVGKSTVDDCVLFLGRFSGGAVASFEATRLATGNYNRNGFEINGEKGAIQFDFERMNELQWWDATLEPGLRGWSTINCSVAGSHPYLEAYWPTGHAIGYEHTFISQAADIVRVLSGKKPVVPLPDFEDAYQTQRVLEAALRSARERRTVRMTEIK
jgi:predicted dehydrogenase